LHLITVWPDHAAWGGPGPALTEIDRALDAARAHTVDASVLPGNTTSQQLFEAGGYHGGPLQYQKSIGPLPSPTETAP
jgi:hypothetical protein